IADDDYRGHTFLNLKSGDKDILPTYINGGGWLPHMGSDTKLCMRLTRCITNHAPIGSFQQRFFLGQYDMSCPCGHELEMREHILNKCPLYERQWTNQERFQINTIAGLAEFLQDNPKAFTFEDKQHDP
ncbi:hypothetical protein P691DRAFT_626154, partial [Macrolepiota fuliginosa MF-IS2]